MLTSLLLLRVRRIRLLGRRFAGEAAHRHDAHQPQVDIELPVVEEVVIPPLIKCGAASPPEESFHRRSYSTSLQRFTHWLVSRVPARRSGQVLHVFIAGRSA